MATPTDEVVTSSDEADESDDAVTSTAHPIRLFRPPKINFDIASYIEMIFWDEQLYEPPLTRKLSEDQLKTILDVPLVVPKFPCHTKMVERGVKMVTEASANVHGHKARERFICQKIKCRTNLSKVKFRFTRLSHC